MMPELPANAPCRRLSAEAIAQLARYAAVQEVNASPKPGLVCPQDQGAHTDMNHASFLASAAALEPYFARCVRLGQAHAAYAEHSLPSSLMPQLRGAGQEAERDMFAATGGVNTHKGLVFSLGLVCAALGCLQQRPDGLSETGKTAKLAEIAELTQIAETAETRKTAEAGKTGEIAQSSERGNPRTPCPDQPYSPRTTAYALCAFVATLVSDVIRLELEPLKKKLPDRPLTAGERLYIEHGVCGIRGEASQGFPGAQYALKRLLHHQCDLPDALALPHTLLELMARLDDTNVLARGGTLGLHHVQTGAQAALQAGGMRTAKGRKAVQALGDSCVRHHISPGGCADLLTLALFFREL